MKKIIFLSEDKKRSQHTENFKNDLKDILLIVEDAHYSYEIWWILVSRDGRKRFFKQMLHYKEFFQATAYAHIALVIINLYKLFETRKDTLNFNKLIRETEKRGLFDPKQINNELKEARRLWKKIGILRNRLFAHKNYLLTKEAIYKEAEINPNQIKKLIDLSLKIFNSLWISLGESPKKIDDFSTRDTNKILEDLSRKPAFIE